MDLSTESSFNVNEDDSDSTVIAAYKAVALRVYAEEHVPFPWEG